MSSKSRSSVNNCLSVRAVLERLYGKYNHREEISPDPLQFVYRYRQAADMEIVGFVASALAYGRVGQIGASLEDLLGRMGESPAGFVRDFDERKRRKLAGFVHRFNRGEDIANLFSVFKKVLERHSSLEKFFLLGYKETDESVLAGLERFCTELLRMHADENGGEVSRGVGYLLSRPSAGSACKRLNLFLRWMVRDDAVDTGIWKGVRAEQLVVPLDTHMARLCRILGLYQTKSSSMKAAVEVTRSFAEIEPADPVKYDFALSRVGIVEGCTGKYRQECHECELGQFCFVDRDSFGGSV